MNEYSEDDKSRGPIESPTPLALPAKGPLEYGLRSRSKVPYARVALPLVAISVVIGAYRHLSAPRPVPSSLMRTPSIVTPQPDAQNVTKVYREEIVPLLDDFNKRNTVAADHAISVLHDRIGLHRAGIKPFTGDITSWGTRFGIVGRYSSDLWERWWHDQKNADSVTAYVNEKFQNRILSEQKLRVDVAFVLKQFDDDMSASRNRLYSELALPLGQIKVPVTINDPNFEKFHAAVQQRAQEITARLAPDTLVADIASIAGGWLATDVATELTETIVAQILVRLGTTMAVEGIEAGGATVGGTTVGGGAGSIGGPVGTVIGAGVGLVAGGFVDWWLSEKFEAKVAEQCNKFLDTVEQRLADGSPASGPTTTRSVTGIRQALGEAVKVVDTAQRDAILSVLKGDAK